MPYVIHIIMYLSI